MDAKEMIATAVSDARDRLTGLSHRLHAYPEVAWAEERAAAWVAAELADAGFDVEANACGMPTAFIARAGSARCTSASAPNTTPCPAWGTPAGTTSSRPPRSAPGARSPPRPTTWG